MIAFFKFMTGTKGRIVQGVLGVLFVVAGLYELDTTAGELVLALGLLLLAGGVLDICFLAFFAGLPFEGPKLRKELLRRQLRRPQARPH